MDNQVYIQSYSNTNAWANSTKEHEEAILHSLIEAQLTQNLSEIEALIEDASQNDEDKLFEVTQNNIEKRRPRSLWLRMPLTFLAFCKACAKSVWLLFFS